MLVAGSALDSGRAGVRVELGPPTPRAICSRCTTRVGPSSLALASRCSGVSPNTGSPRGPVYGRPMPTPPCGTLPRAGGMPGSGFIAPDCEALGGAGIGNRPDGGVSTRLGAGVVFAFASSSSIAAPMSVSARFSEPSSATSGWLPVVDMRGARSMLTSVTPPSGVCSAASTAARNSSADA